MASGDFKLSAQLIGHESDVRALTFPSADLIVSVSRDCTVRKWVRGPSSPPSFEGTLLSRGSDYVNSVAFFPSSKAHPDGLVVSGGKDTIIEVKSPSAASTDNAERLLIGHAHNVCTLDVSPSGTYLLSGGWDGQARVWNLAKWETELMLSGHEGMSVWAVVALDDTTAVTACADKNIRVFDLTKSTGGEVQPKSTIYTPDVVRALCKVAPGHPSGADIASASNDGTIRLWKLNGQQVGELHGHESFVYCLASLPTGELVSSGEDRTVRVWKGSECVQTITHPAISVWTVAVNQDTGDIVTGASDSIARVFTRRPDQVADKETIGEFESSVKSSAIPQQQLGGINKERLPGPEFLTSKSGTKEGQVQMIMESNGNVTAHQWSMSQQQWINVGTVVDAVGSSGRKVEYKGQSYDYVFDVDIEDGKPPLKLPYNLSENPYERATKFLNDNELPLSYLDNVAKFITQNTQGATIGQQTRDPGYNPGDVETGGKILPQSDYLSITAAKYDPMFTKLLTVNKNLVSSGRKDAALNPGDESVIQSLKLALETSKPIPAGAWPLVVRMVSQWEYSDRLAALDLLRCVATAPSVAKQSQPTVVDLATTCPLPDDGKPSENAVMMGARAIANVFSTKEGETLVIREAEKVFGFLERVAGVNGEAIGKHNRNVLIAVTTTILNLAVLANKDNSLDKQRLTTLTGAVLDGQTDSEVLYRGLVALGTLVSGGAKADAGVLRGARERGAEDRVKAVADECMQLMQTK